VSDTVAGQNEAPRWDPSKFSLWTHRLADPNDTNPTSILLRHPQSPFVRVMDKIDDPTMQQIGFDYLSEVSTLPDLDPPLGLPTAWIDALNPAARRDPTFGWLPIGWPNPASANPLVSFRVERLSWLGPLPDQSIVLMASELFSFFGSTPVALGSGFGIRLLAHAQKRGKKFLIRITGLSASLPFGPYRRQQAWLNAWPNNARAREFFLQLLANKTEIASTLGLPSDSLHIRGLRLSRLDAGNWQIESRGTGSAKAAAAGSVSYAFVHVGIVSTFGTPVGTISSAKVPLAAEALSPTPGNAWIFPRDPASQDSPQDLRKRRPTRSEKDLDNYRVEKNITAGQSDPLIYPRPHYAEQMRVIVCPGFVADDANATPGDPKIVNLPGSGPPIRSNDFSAVMAFYNVEDFFYRLACYGLAADAYFRIAKLPLMLAYRSGIRPGPAKDGQTINAQVRADGWPDDFVGPTPPSQRPTLEMHFALANLSHRRRVSNGPAEPLGIATDSRWVWHEIGHVLLMASVGELEFRFAHSAGDALAAIAADPDSKLALNAYWRGATFPWVFIPRRHDRCVSLGWSWGGSLHEALAQVPNSMLPRRKGYWTEQILSSSLFRLYRSIGGETTDVSSVRRSASHYSVYLVMRAIQILGDSGIVPANDPDQFISAMIDADIGTGKWNITYDGQMFKRTGGCVHKVIRWAFEAQGMYANPGTTTNAPGLPPPVDIYIEDLRPTAENGGCCDVHYGPGTYVPVALDWKHDAPAWQANPDAIRVSGNNIYVKVWNRGSERAKGVTVTVWMRDWPMNTLPPASWFKGKGWARYTPHISPSKNIAPGKSASFGPFSHVPPGKRYLVLAAADCGDDRSNINPAGHLPCSRLTAPFVELIASDNNLALREITLP